MKAKQRTRRERLALNDSRRTRQRGTERKAQIRDEEERRDDVSIPPESAFKKAEGKILIRTFRLDRPNLLMLLPSGPIYKCKIAYVPLSANDLENSFFICVHKFGFIFICM